MPGGLAWSLGEFLRHSRFLGCCCEDDNYIMIMIMIMAINDNYGRFLGIGASTGFRSVFLCDFRGPDALIPRSGLGMLMGIY